MLEASQEIGSNLLASIIGFIALIFGAAGVFGQLQDALNTMWEVAPKPKQGLWGALKARFLSFTMVMGVGFLLLVSLVVSALLTVLQEWSVGLLPGFEFLMQVVNFLVSLLIITVLFALIFKYVPDAEIRWKDVWLGAAVTATRKCLSKAGGRIFLPRRKRLTYPLARFQGFSSTSPV
jgi:membrane protein